ncbi:MAG: magnesium and cobalt transport protein CorA [Desulfuromonas sp.]|nr:MAG: magnesium and cobalt transport protein CorA [Desulfuromonas sp.]
MKRNRLISFNRRKIGAAPGSLVHVGERKIETPRITCISYTLEEIREETVHSATAALTTLKEPGIHWINVDGLHDIALIETLGQGLGLHPLTQEDILNTEHRPKYEAFEEHLFIALKMLSLSEEHHINAEQVSLILGPNVVISFQEQQGDLFEGVRTRLRQGKGRLRKMGSDYLAYALVDAVVDGYFVVIEGLGEEIETLEEQLIGLPDPENLRRIHTLKREMVMLRRAVWPLREAISALQRDESPFVTPSTEIFLRDLYDHTIQVMDTVETFRDIVAGLLDLYLSTLSNRMNEVMKVLTIMASFFIPLTFIAGIYGMNFEQMPELHWRWGYPAVWLLMGGSALGMFLFFKRKRWL